MTKEDNIERPEDDAMVKVLEQLLAEDVDITARAVARLHPALKAASSIHAAPCEWICFRSTKSGRPVIDGGMDGPSGCLG